MELLFQFRLWLSQITEGLANLTVKTVLMAVGLMLLALVVLRPAARSRERLPDWLVENIQVVLSVVVVVFLIIRPFLFQAFYIPSDSMVPTLMGPRQGGSGRETSGDRLLVDKLIYRVSDPQRFDIAVFKAPRTASDDEKEFIKRVIGLPNETIEVVPPRLLVNGRVIMKFSSDGQGSAGILSVMSEHVNPRVVKNRVTLQTSYDASGSLKVIVHPEPAVRAGPAEVFVNGVLELEDASGNIQEENTLLPYGWDESLVGRVFSTEGQPRLVVVQGKQLTADPGHVMIYPSGAGQAGIRLQEPYLNEASRYAYGPRRLAADEYFMMGDNRNNSNDSHSWGPLTRDRIIGRAEILFWPLDRVRILHWWLLSIALGLAVGYQAMQRLTSR